MAFGDKCASALRRGAAVAAAMASGACLLAGAALAQSSQADTQPSTGTDGETAAVILMYHRFGETDYPSTSVNMDQFEAHIAELTNGDFNVVPLPEIVAALRDGRKLPDRTVAITVDDAYSSVFERAWPILQRENLPFTLFVATEPVDRGIPGYMTWDQIKQLHEAGVTIGSQAVTHPHMPTRSSARNRLELVDSAQRIAAQTGESPTLFAYPYGEASAEIMQLTSEAGYLAAFGQHSGVANSTSDRYYLPRFPINVNYGGIDRFRRLINTRPLWVSNLTPKDPLLPAGKPGNPPAFGFSVADKSGDLESLNCYHSDTSRITQFEQLGNRIEVRFDAPFAPGRTRINCTMPTRDGRWRWFGMQYYVAPPN